MIECIFTIDYEIYGNGQGSLHELVFAPMQKLIDVFERFNARMVVFVEAAELEMIEDAGSDKAIKDVIEQIQQMYEQGHEIALHLHPQWYNAVHKEGAWKLDYSEYNLCTLPESRIAAIVDRSINWLRRAVSDPQYTPVSFRAGNWLFQPTATAAKVLAERGIKIDSSVFKGGVQHQHGLDYRRSLENGNFWRFSADVNVPDPDGVLLEAPIYTTMVPFWKMATSKRTGFKNSNVATKKNIKQRLYQLIDRARLLYPLKFDFCRMTLSEITTMIDTVINKNKINQKNIPLVSIGHTKDLVDIGSVNLFLSHLKEKSITISTLSAAKTIVKKGS